MEELKIICDLNKTIKEEYIVDNAYEFSMALVNAGYTEIFDDIREKILFLKEICKEINLNNYWVISLVTYHSLDDIKARYGFYKKYSENARCDIDNLALSCEKGEVYVSLLARLGLSSEQMNCIMKTIVNQGAIIKSEEDARSIIDDLALFELPIDIRNQFICDNAEYFFNDYFREIHQVFVALCQKYGKKEGFAYLKEHPEYIRFGVKTIK